MLHNPDFDSKEVDPDLHKRMEKAVEDGQIRCFNMREGPADGDQDLNFWTRDVEDVVREIMEDPIFKDNQNYKFEMDLDKAGKRVFGGEANAGVAFQIGQLRYILVLSWYILVCTGMYQYVLLCTNIYFAGLGTGLFHLPSFCTLTAVSLSTKYPSSRFRSLITISTLLCLAKLVHGGCWACCQA